MSGASGERRVLLIGGTSEIGQAIVRRLAAEGPVRAFLLGRDAAAEVVVDARDIGSHEDAIARAFAEVGGFDVVVLAVGVLGGQAGLDARHDEATEVMNVDFLGAGSLLLASLRRLRDQGHGTMVVLSSVAAERPRASNAIYGAAKAGLDSLAQGLGDGLAGSGVQVLVVRPGFVKTRMTAGLKPAPFATTPDAVAAATVRGLRRGEHTVWVPGVLRYVFAVLRHLPRAAYRRLPL